MEEPPTLEEYTDEFFRLHWNDDLIGDQRPEWNTWNLNGVPLEAARGGCYAIYEGEDLLYIGVAVTEGKNTAKTGKKYGLLKRLERHVLRKGPKGSLRYLPQERKAQWQNITTIRLIGFPDQYRHLAAALEAYLINRLTTTVNAQSRWR